MEKITHTQFMRNQMDVTMHKVAATLGITVQDYIQHLYNCSTDWLMHHLNHDYDAADNVMQCQEFYKWWALHAYHRDCQWLQTIANAVAVYNEPNRLIADWLYYHSATRLTNLKNKQAQTLFNAYANINWV
jgi:hypothetical protein